MMKHIRTFLFLALCLGIGVGIGKIIVWWRHQPTTTPPAIVTGVGRLPHYRGFTVEPHAGTTPQAIAELVTAVHSLHATSLAIHYPASGNGQDLSQFMQTLRALPAARDLPLVLLPPATPASGIMNPYPRPLPEIAAEAQRLGFTLFVATWLTREPDEAYWRSQFTAIRKAFTGKLILAADYELIAGLDCWDAVDYVATFSTWDLTEKPLPSIHDLRIAWQARFDTFESLGELHKKQVFVLDLGFPPIKPPASAKKPAPDLQLSNYEALLLETKGRTQTDGFFFRAWNLGTATPDPMAVNARPEILQIVDEIWKSTALPPPNQAPAVSETEPDLDD